MLQNFLTMFLSRLTVRKTVEAYEKDQQKNTGTLKQPQSVLVVGAISMAFSALLIAASFVFADGAAARIVCGIVFGCLFVLGLFLVLYGKNFLVIYREGEIIYRDLFCRIRKFDCGEIESAFYTDSGGIKILFRDGRKLSFAKEERYFYKEILKKEHLKCRFPGDENEQIKVCLHPFLMYPFWILCVCMIVASFFYPSLFLFAGVLFLVCLGCQMSDTTYDKKNKILTRRRCGLSKKYDMRFCTAKPVYQDRFLMAIEIYENKKKVVKVPVSAEYINRAGMAKALCGAEV